MTRSGLLPGMDISLILVALVALWSLAMPGHAEPAPPLPTGGADLIAVKDVGELEFVDGGAAEMQAVAVRGLPFTRAVRVDVNGTPRSTWSVQLNANNQRPVAKGDVVHVRVWMRCVASMTGEGFAAVKFELDREPYDQTMAREVSFPGEWTLLDFPFVSDRAYDTHEAKVTIQLGFGKQVVEVGGVTCLNYGRGFDRAALPMTRITYSGLEADAPWRSEAAERIERLRKGDLTVRVVDAGGRPVEGARVEAAMTRHAFRFGSAVVADLLANPQDHPDYVSKVEELFNEVVFENDLKWVNHGTGDPDDIAAALRWLDERGITVRGHVLVWPGWQWLPQDLPALAESPDELRRRVAGRVTEAATRFRGRLADWDVLNEPFNNHDLMDLLGNEVMVEWFELAKQADPDTKRYINDWGILTAGGRDAAHQDHYHDTIRYLIENGAPLDGIGLQGHFGSTLTPPDRLLEILDRFAAFGKRIKVTELDIVMDDEQLRADYMRDLLTVLFSHEAVDGVIMWGFWANAHWKPEAALYDADWNLRPHGRAWIDLVRGEWWTHETGVTAADGTFQLRGFCGAYAVTVTHGGRTHASTPSLTRDGAVVEIVLD